MLDYHVHCHFSCDSETTPEQFFTMAEERGIDELCFVDHLDYGFCLAEIPHVDTDFAARDEYLTNMKYSGNVRYKRGMEVGLLPRQEVYDYSANLVRKVKPDFVLGSVHILGRASGPDDAIDPYSPVYFETRTRAQGYIKYLERVYECINAYDEYDSLGHMTYPARVCPYEDCDPRHSDAPELLDAIFRHLIERGKTFELNTADYKRAADLDNYVGIYRRFRELGGEYVTIGTDSHGKSRFSFMLRDGYDMIRAAGIKYVASYENRKPVMHPIG